jgi:hypothetical protein
MGLLIHVLGIDYGLTYGKWSWYNLWSGFGGDLAIVGSLLASPALYWRHHNCHQPRCPRIGHPVDGVVKCRHHRTQN